MFGIAMILIQVKSPMLVAIGMYLPLATTSAIFIGGMIRWLSDSLAEKKGYNAAQRARVENIGILIASGFIAGEALVIGLPMLVVAFATVLVSHSLFPDETDFRVLLALPISRRVVFLSKLGALALFAGLFIVATHLAADPGRLREGLRGRRCKPDQLWRYARKARVWSIMRPYVEAMVSDAA